MLDTLQIENYALIEQLTIEFAPGFNVLTGETGSGKSIIVDALGLLLGERAEAGAVRAGASQATVTGSFATPFASTAEAAAWCEENGLAAVEDPLMLRREVSPGRSRAFVDHQLASLALLRQLARRLGEIHSQNEALAAFTPAAQLALLDRFAGLETGAVGAAFRSWRAASEALAELQSQERVRLQQADLWRFQAQEIDAVRPRAGEDAALEQERLVLAHAERIVSAAQAAYAALYDSELAAATQIKAALRQVQEWERYQPEVGELGKRLEGLRAEASDVAEQIRDLSEKIEASPARLAQVEERLAALERLRRKYGTSLEAVIAHRASVGEQLEALEGATLQAAEAAAEAAASEYQSAAAELGKARRGAARRLAKALTHEVAELAMTLRFDVEFADACAWGASGCDQIRFLASLNAGEPLRPLADIASGGELSRLLLGLHLVVERQAKTGGRGAPARTLVLDEIDAGIGGRAAEAVGRKLKQLGTHFQVLCVTHLAQIASFADHHLQVEKSTERGRTRTAVAPLGGAERAAEIARMLAGKSEDPTALQHARELLAQSAGGRG